jgi:glycine/D-amino acid oxidase-like deaminating enzyme
MKPAAFVDGGRAYPYWWEEAPLAPAEADPILPGRADVVVVGAGYTGLSAALALARARRSVLVLDAKLPGEGASTRSGGMIGSGYRVGLGELERRHGREAAKALVRESMNALEFTLGLVEREGIACHLQQVGRFRGAWLPAHYEAMAREVERQRRELGLEADMVPAAEARRREVATDRYHGGAVYHRHGGVHPALLHAGLLARARDAGALVLGRTPAVGIGAGTRGAQVATDRGEVAAGQVVVATNGYTPAAAGGLLRGVVPVPSFLVATEELGENRVRSLIPGGRMVVETRSAHCYYRASPDGKRLLLGGRAALHPIPPTRAAARLRRLLVGLFPELQGVALTHAWTGNVAMTRSGLPAIGRRGDGIWYALGCCGSGVATMPYLGWRVAQKILGTPEGRTALDDVPLAPYPLYDGRPWFLPLGSLWWRLRDLREGSG